VPKINNDTVFDMLLFPDYEVLLSDLQRALYTKCNTTKLSGARIAQWHSAGLWAG